MENFYSSQNKKVIQNGKLLVNGSLKAETRIQG